MRKLFSYQRNQPTRTFLALFAIVSMPLAAAHAQKPEPVRISLVRTGVAAPPTVTTFVDGVPITALANHRMVVFAVSPGKHELSAGTGADRITCVFTSSEGKFLYAELSRKRSASAKALLYDLQMVEMITDGDAQVITLKPSALKHILEAAHPADPKSH